jgi:hypothetical protein
VFPTVASCFRWQIGHTLYLDDHIVKQFVRPITKKLDRCPTIS